MRKYLLPEEGNSYKANLHCHSTFSDGKKTPEEIKEIYKSLGYSIVAYTDHDILLPHDELNDEGFLALHGFEMEINQPRPEGMVTEPKTCHICFIGLEPDNITQPMWHRTKYLFGNAPQSRDKIVFDETLPDYERVYTGEKITEIMNIGREKGFFVTYNHPTWSQESYPEYIEYSGMHAFEIFNGSCIASGFEDYNTRVYTDLIRAGKRIYCIGADDNHNARPFGTRKCDSGWAFTVIKANSLDYRTVTKALEDGNFYASEGPEIKELWYEDGVVHIKSSDADGILVNTGRRSAFSLYAEGDETVNEAEFTLKPDSGYFRVTVIDKRGRRACSNAYYIDELEK